MAVLAVKMLVAASISVWIPSARRNTWFERILQTGRIAGGIGGLSCCKPRVPPPPAWPHGVLDHECLCDRLSVLAWRLLVLPGAQTWRWHGFCDLHGIVEPSSTRHG